MGRLLQSGQFLQGRYRILSLLAKGGMGAIYYAWDVRLEIPVAIKEMVPQPDLDEHILEQLCQQFKQEAMVLARLQHSHLVRVTDFFEEGENVYLVMDFVAGENLAEFIEKNGALPESQGLALVGQLLDALAYCHSQGVFHRDIKPQNVIIRPNNQAVLVDFGLVKLWNPDDPHTKTAMRGVGTAEYAPPEQYDAKGSHTDARTDLYSVGALLYHILVGQAPPTVTMRIVDPLVMPAARKLNPKLSERAEKIVLRAMELQPKDRFQTAEEMQAALTGRLPRPAAVSAAPHDTRTLPSPASQLAKEMQPAAPARRKTLPVWLRWGVIVVAVLVVGLVVLRALTEARASWQATATPTASPTAVLTIAPTVTDKPTSTRTSAPSSTPTLTPTNTPTPTVTLTPTRAFTPRTPTFTPRPPTFTPIPPTNEPRPTNEPPPPTNEPPPPEPTSEPPP